MKNKTILLTIFLAVGFSFQQCLVPENECICPPLEGEFYDIKGMEAFLSRKSNTGTPWRLKSNESISSNNLEGIAIYYSIGFVSENALKKSPFSFSLMNSALACDCFYNGWRGAKDEKVESIEVVTLYDFDETHPKNSLLNDRLVVKKDGRVYELDEYPIQDTSLINSRDLLISLKQSPTANDTFKVAIRLKLNSNEIYTDTTNHVIVTL
jgi:hypothetical protein